MTYTFTENEQKVRKHWLIAVAVNWLVALVYLVISMIIGYDYYADQFSGQQKQAALELASSLNISMFVTWIVVSILLLWWLIHCAYKKSGYRILTLFMILAIISMVMDVLNIVSYSRFIQTTAFTISFLYCILSFFLTLWWFIVSVKLRRINKAKRKAT